MIGKPRLYANRLPKEGGSYLTHKTSPIYWMEIEVTLITRPTIENIL